MAISTWMHKAKDEALFLITTREGLIGDYDYRWLLTPDIPPFNRSYRSRKQPFYGIDDRIPLLLTVLLGLQHMLSMIGGGELVPNIYPPSSARNGEVYKGFAQ